jgi:peroxin-5
LRHINNMDCNAGAAIGQSLFGSAGGGHALMGGPEMHDDVGYSDQLMGGGGPEFAHMDQWAHDFHGPHGMMPPAAMPSAGMHEMIAQHEAEMMEAAFANAALADAQQQQRQPADDQHMMDDAFHGDDWLEQFHQQAPTTEGEQWADDYASEEVQVFTVEGEPLLTVEEKTQASQFHAFMGKVRTQEVVIDEENGVVAPGPGPSATDGWEAEFAAAQRRGDMDDVDDWAAEGAEQETTMEQAWNEHEGHEEAALRAAWGSDDGEDHLYNEFANHDFNEDPGEEWFKEYENMQSNFRNAQDSTDYPFEPNNPYLFHEDPYMEGFALQQAGNLAEAVLAFEAACQKDLSHQEAWKTLGVTQAENEKDTMAIRALNKARELNPKDVEVHAALAVSHTNESNHAQALRALKEWLLAQPAYETLGSVVLHDDPAAAVAQEDDFVNQFLFVSPSEHRDCETLFQAAIQLNPTDAELHSSLGVLKNLSHEYGEAAVHFHNALEHRPNDAKLWNKLGATLANGNRSQEALEAYDKALDINPGYVRAHYNLGIAHSNLGQHNLAAKQLLRAIILQQGGVQTAAAGGAGVGSGSSTREMWDVLRMTLNLMDRSDLVDLTWKQDVMPFLSEFGLEDFA